MASEPVRLAATELALVSRQPVLTAPMRLPQQSPGAPLGVALVLRLEQQGQPGAWGIKQGPPGLVSAPPGAENPPIFPPAASTRWHGTINGTGFAAIAFPTSRAASGPAPSSFAIVP